MTATRPNAARRAPFYPSSHLGAGGVLVSVALGAHPIGCRAPPHPRPDLEGPVAEFARISANAAADRRFSVRYKGIKIGTHTVSYSSATGETRVKTDNLEVKVAFLTAYAFSHRSEETWRAGRLMLLNSDTVEHGETLHVEARQLLRDFVS